MVQIKFYISFYIYIFIVKMRKTKKTNWVFRKWIIFILIWFFTLSITKAATIPDGLTLIRANIWNAVQYIKQSIFTSSGINSWTKLMDINADSKYVWINTWLLNIWTPFNQKFLSLDENWYLIYSDIPFFSGTQSPNYYVNEISFDSWTNVLTLNISWVWPITWYLEGIQWAQGPQGATWPQWIQWFQGEQWPQWIQWNTWATGATWAKWDTWATWPQGEQGIQWATWAKWDTWEQWPQWPQGITGAQGATWPAGPSLDRYLTGISFDINTNLLTLYVSGATTLSTTIDSYRRLWQSNYIYNYNTGQKVLIWNQTWAEPETQVEIRNNSWYNLLLKNYSSDVGAVAWLWFWVQNQPWFKAGIIFQSIDSYGRGELILWLNNDTQTQQQSIIDWDAIMRLKHVWETGAVGILKSPEIEWVALDINDTMRLEPRSEVPFDCTEETLWSIFFIKKFYKEVWYAYPCFCGYLNPNSQAQEYEWLAMGRWNNVKCLADI